MPSRPCVQVLATDNNAFPNALHPVLTITMPAEWSFTVWLDDAVLSAVSVFHFHTKTTWTLFEKVTKSFVIVLWQLINQVWSEETWHTF